MKKLIALFLFAVPIMAQVNNPGVRYVTPAPSGSCAQSPPIQVVNSTGTIYTCNNGTWAAQGGGGSSGFPITIGSTSIASGSTTTSISGLTLVAPALGTPTALVLTNATGLPAAQVLSGALVNGMTATTQSQLDGSTKISTTAYTDLAVSNAVAGVNPAVAVLAASTANVVGTYTQVGGGVGDTFTVTATGAFTLDGIAINTIGQRVLLKDQTTASQNGVYFASVVGASLVSPVFTRALDYDTPSDVNNTGTIPVQSGTVNATTSWLLTSQVTSIGSAGSSLTYAKFSLAPSTLVTASSPGVGIAHFAGSTQTVTSSAVNLAGADVTGLLPHANIAATAVTPGSYSNANITVAADGSVTAAANGSGGSNTLTNLCSTVTLASTGSGTITCTSGVIVFTGVTTFTTSAIPGTFVKLEGSIQGVAASGDERLLIHFNSDTTTADYRCEFMAYTGSSANSNTCSANSIVNGIQWGYLGAGSTDTASTDFSMPFYAGSTPKTGTTQLYLNNISGNPFAGVVGWNWTGTAAITSISWTTVGGVANAMTGSLILYGRN